MPAFGHGANLAQPPPAPSGHDQIAKLRMIQQGLTPTSLVAPKNTHHTQQQQMQQQRPAVSLQTPLSPVQNQNRGAPNSTTPLNSMNSMNSGYGGMGMGGMGGSMGMMGMMSMMPFMGGGMGGGGPMSWIYSLNYFVSSVGHMMALVGMNSQALMGVYHNAFSSYQQIVQRVKTSEIRRIIQRKCKRSRLFKFLFTTAVAGLVGAAVKVVQAYIGYQSRARLTNGPYGASSGGYGSYGGSNGGYGGYGGQGQHSSGSYGYGGNSGYGGGGYGGHSGGGGGYAGRGALGGLGGMSGPAAPPSLAPGEM